MIETIDTAALVKRLVDALDALDMDAVREQLDYVRTEPQARALAALLRGVADGPKVKLLEWVIDFAGHSAEMPFGEYTCDGDEDEEVASFPWVCSSPDEIMGHFETLDAAKAAAQSDYEQRIRSALVLPAPPITTKEG